MTISIPCDPNALSAYPNSIATLELISFFGGLSAADMVAPTAVTSATTTKEASIFSKMTLASSGLPGIPWRSESRCIISNRFLDFFNQL